MTADAFAVRDAHLFLRWKETETLLSGEYLRSNCRCAECRYLQLNGAEIKNSNVELQALTPMGYGLQLHFSDGHNRGIYPWPYLRELTQQARTFL